MKYLLIALLAVTGGLAAPSASAALPYNNGDFFLGFRASGGTGATQNYLVNIGSASLYTSATSSFVVTGRGNIGADLAAVFGPDWSTRDDAFWSVSGANLAGDLANTLYATRNRISVGTPATPWLGRSNSSQGVANSKFNALAGAFINGTASDNSAFGIIQGIADPNSYASFQPGGTAINSAGISFGAFNPSIEGSFINGVLGSVLDLFKVAPIIDQPAANAGNFRLDSAGNLIYTPAGATPVATLRFELTQSSINEADVAGQVSLKIVRSGDLSGAISVHLSTSNGTAVAETDFLGQTNVPVAFAANQSEATVNIAVTNRAGIQGDRSFTVALADASAGATAVSPSSASVTIVEAGQINGELAFSSAAFSAFSLDAQGNPSSIPLTITRTGGSVGDVSVDLSIAGGTLVNGTDYETFTNPTTIAFAAGETTKNVGIQLNAVAASKLPGTIVLSLANATGGAAIGTQSTATITVNFNNRPLVAGTYNGLLLPISAAGQPGFVAITVSATGAFTGKVTTGKDTFAVRGTFGSDGIAHFKPSLATTLALVGKVGVQLGSLELAIDGEKMIGALKSDANTVVASVDSDRAFFDGKTASTTVDAKYLKNRGFYTAVLPAGTSEATLTASETPQGNGFGSITVNAKGNVTFKGKLADGTVVSSSGRLTKDYKWQLFAPLYGKLGSLAGTATFDDTQADSDIKALDLVWTRPAIAGAKYYPAGWPSGINVNLLAASYAIPPKSAVTSVFPGLGAVDLVNGNTTLEFTGGKLAETLTKNVNIAPTNKATVAPLTDKSFTLTIVKATGEFKGTILHSDTTKPAFQGVVFQKGVNAGGYGYFLSKPASGSTGESGAVTLSAKP